ncbi:monooxygenase [Austwickia chelonae]|uniref:monooxygenase n=1 Tax=Austwickia chelonae TaxID=100225 RepID=UPI000E2734B5|nr:monooxygenase [Austwickia chelonae]
MSAVALQIDFPSPGPWGEEMSEAYAGLARQIADEPGLLWKIWTEDAAQGIAGGIYLFTDRAHAQDYLTRHEARLAGFGITDIRARILDVNFPLSAQTHAPVR